MCIWHNNTLADLQTLAFTESDAGRPAEDINTAAGLEQPATMYESQPLRGCCQTAVSGSWHTILPCPSVPASPSLAQAPHCNNSTQGPRRFHITPCPSEHCCSDAQLDRLPRLSVSGSAAYHFVTGTSQYHSFASRKKSTNKTTKGLMGRA